MIRAIRDLFLLVNNNRDKKCIIKISYIEIYNEIIKDLLNTNNNITGDNSNNIDIRNDPQKGIFLQGVQFINVSNENEAYNLILKGNKKRTEKTTEFNENSSRSHAILQINLEIQEKIIKLDNSKNLGKFMLLDLAGSEKASFTLNSKGNKELGSINKSLLALNKCITLLTSQNRKFIPWRESKLTRLLQEPLSGNSHVVMIATASPALTAFDETMFTLQYANRAKNLKVKIKKNVLENNDVRINKYDEFIHDIKEEIVDIKKNILEQDIAIKNNLSTNNINNINNEAKDIYINNNKINNNNNNNDAKLKNNNEKEYDKICREMMEHFDSEIKLKRKIIEKENIIEELKDDLAKKEFEILHAPRINVHYLKKQLEEKREDIKDKESKMIKGYIKQNELNMKRKEFQKIISNLAKKDTNNPEYFILYNIYKYNINLLENMNSEHKKNKNFLESKRKDKKIEGLMEQIDIRDQFIRNVYYQFEKNDIEFKYKNPKLISSNQLEKIPFRPKILKIVPNTTHSLLREFNPEKNNENDSDEKNIKKNNDEKKYIKKINISKYEKQRNEKIEKLNNVKKQLMGKIIATQKRQYNSEILSLFNNHPIISKNNKKNGLDINNFIRNKKLKSSNNNINNESLLIKHNLSDNALMTSKVNKKVRFVLKPIVINIPKVNSGLLSERSYKKRYTNKNNINKPIEENKTNKINKNNENEQVNNINLTSKFENEVQKKVKTILNKNYIGRYKNSPYLKFLNE